MGEDLLGSPKTLAPLSGFAVPGGFGGIIKPFWSFSSKNHDGTNLP